MSSWLKLLLVLMFIGLISAPLLAQVNYLTSDVDTLMGLWYSDSDWGDYDNDNDLDLLEIGYGLVSGQGIIKLYRNEGNSVFSDIANSMPAVGNGSCRFADLDGDNDLDVLICGQAFYGIDTLRIFINNAGIFTDCGVTLPNRVSCSASFGDYDNDGDLDILMTGGTIAESSIGYLQIFRNDGNFSFSIVNVATTGVRNGNAEFGDYDNDGWLDVVVTGSAGSGNYITKIYQGSSSGVFTDAQVTLLGLRYSRVAWVDYDCDGDLDILLSGSYVNESPSVFKLYRNDGNSIFTEVPQTAVLGERQGDLAWGDFNNDGYPDIILNGLITNTTTVANVYLYDHLTDQFVDSQAMTYLKYACMSVGDYNNDSKLDLSLSGHYDYQDYWNHTYLNSYTVNNTPPTAPIGLSSIISENNVYLLWDIATDTETPSAGLTYNLMVGTAPDGNDIISSMAVSSTGWRKVARQGNCWNRTFYQLNNLAEGVYYWSVQAIDNTFAGSTFAPQQSFTIGVGNDDEYLLPISFISNHPNPFTRETRISVALKTAGNTKIEVYNIKGQLVKKLTQENLGIGIHNVIWDGTDIHARQAASGIYTARVTCGNEVKTHKLMLIK